MCFTRNNIKRYPGQLGTQASLQFRQSDAKIKHHCYCCCYCRGARMSSEYTSKLMLPMNSMLSSHESPNTAKGLIRLDQAAPAAAATCPPYNCTASRLCGYSRGWGWVGGGGGNVRASAAAKLCIRMESTGQFIAGDMNAKYAAVICWLCVSKCCDCNGRHRGLQECSFPKTM